MKKLFLYVIGAIVLMAMASCQNSEKNVIINEDVLQARDVLDIKIDSVIAATNFDTFEKGSEKITVKENGETYERQCPVNFYSPEGEVLDTVFILQE